MEKNTPIPSGQLRCFLWHLHNPFLPDAEAETLFCFRFPALTWWKATLRRTEERTTGYSLPVSFSLQYLADGGNPDEDCNATLSVNISEIGTRSRRIRMQAHSFNKENQYTYTSNASIRRGSVRLAIQVWICVRNEDQNQRYLDFDEEPVRELSSDLGKLPSSDLYVDLRLLSDPPTWTNISSRNSGFGYPVHSYILRERWPHCPIDTAVPNVNHPPKVETDILSTILDGILTYVYTASIAQFDWRRPPDDDKTELFQVIDKYKLRHLHVRLEPNGMMHERRAITQVFGTVENYVLRGDGYSPTYIWKRNLVKDVDVSGSIVFHLRGRDVPSFRYSLTFTSTINVSVRVSLEYKREVVGLERVTRTVVYEQDYQVPRNGRVGPKSDVPMEGILEHLMDFIAGEDRTEGEYEVEHSFRFSLYVSTGMNVIQIRREYEGVSFDDEVEGLFLLSKHMSAVQRRGDGTNLCVTVFESTSSDTSKEYNLHKSIIQVRVPNWRHVFEVSDVCSNIPDNLRLENGAFPCIIEYIYTGTYWNIPDKLLKEVEYFANGSGLDYLKSRVNMFEYENELEKKYPSMISKKRKMLA